MVVMKFGGASIRNSEDFDHIAEIIIQRSLGEKQLVVVVSAMANQTDSLLALAKQIHPDPPRRELDMLVSIGERTSIALLAMALAKKGKQAVSFTGSQSGILTCENHTNARIVEIRPKRIVEALARGKIAIVAGFQGMSRQGEITTLGRGGSDTSAVALSVALGFQTTEFYKDVDGIFDQDPKSYPQAKKFSSLSYEEAICLAEKGAKILHPRCIELARKNQVQLVLRSFHRPEEIGTVVGLKCQRECHPYYEELACLPS